MSGSRALLDRNRRQTHSQVSRSMITCSGPPPPPLLPFLCPCLSLLGTEVTFFRNLPLTDVQGRAAALQEVPSKSIYLSAAARMPKPSSPSPAPPKDEASPPQHTRISSTWRALELGCIISALGGNWLLHTICSSFSPYTPPTPAAATTVLLTTANPAGISFEANSPLTADHFFFIWQWSHRPLMSPPACGGIKRGLLFERASMFHV